MSVVLADTWAGGHAWFLLIPLFWIAVILCFRFFWWRGPWRGGWGGGCGYDGSRGPDPRRIIAERYARGEITHDEYRERLSNLGN
jgi:uncharacterized membrane protein